jgi:hypothetical protein
LRIAKYYVTTRLATSSVELLPTVALGAKADISARVTSAAIGRF